MSVGFHKPFRASFIRPDKQDEAYFFLNDRFVHISVAPGTGRDAVIRGPHKITETWQTLARAGFSRGITAALPSSSNPSDIYFFHQDRCALLKVDPVNHSGWIIEGPRPAMDFWPCLRRLGWHSIDSASQGSPGRDEVYFFHGTEYVVANICEGTVTRGPCKISETWRATGFSYIESVLPNHADRSQAYFFSGQEYALVHLLNGRVIDGPRGVAEDWSSLRRANFYHLNYVCYSS